MASAIDAATPLTIGPRITASGDQAARKAAEEFEAVFVNELLEHMDQGLSTDGPFTGGQSEGVYRSLLNDAIARQIAKGGGLGIATQIYAEILKMQEAQVP